jgi:hypothetical protein
VASEYVHPRDTHCESSDIRAWWPACRDYSPSEQVKGGNYHPSPLRDVSTPREG